MSLNLRPYQARAIRFLELWEIAGWRLKVYGITCGSGEPSAGLAAAGKRVVEEKLRQVDAAVDHYGVGFLGIHEGETANFVFVDWWADENELHHHVWASAIDDPIALEYTTPSGVIACVWDIRLIGFERDAWVGAALQNSGGPDLDDYLERRLNEDV